MDSTLPTLGEIKDDCIYTGREWQPLRGRCISLSLQTYSGRFIWPLDPYVDEIRVADVAHGLAAENRYANQTPLPYSVGWHSVALSHVVPAHLQRFALVHDAPEAYIKDMPRTIRKQEPFKTEYDKIDNRLLDVCCEAFGVENQMDELYPFDIRISHSEMIVWGEENPVFMAKMNAMGILQPEDYTPEYLEWVRAHPAHRVDVEKAWLARFDELFN